MTYKSLSKALIYIICLFPLFYNYFNLLPDFFKWTDEILCFLIFVGLFSREYKAPKNKIFKYYKYYIVFIVLIMLTSAFLNKSSLELTIAVLIKTAFPFFLFYIFYTILSIYKQECFNSVFTKIFYIQLFLVPIEYFLFLYYYHFKNLLIADITYNPFDIATGTLGNAGTSELGVLVVLFFIFSLTYLKRSYSYIFLIPLIFIFSGGGNILLLIAIPLIIVLSKKSLKKAVKSIAYICLLIGIISGASYYILKTDIIQTSSQYIEKFYVGVITSEEESSEFTANKLTRVGGFYYVDKNLKTKTAKLVGLGPDVVKESRATGMKSHKLGVITDIKDEFLLRFSQIGYLGLVIVYLFYLFVLFYFIKRFKQGNYYYSGTIIMILYIVSTLYVQSMNKAALIAFMSYFLAISVIYDQGSNSGQIEEKTHNPSQ